MTPEDAPANFNTVRDGTPLSLPGAQGREGDSSLATSQSLPKKVAAGRRDRSAQKSY